MRPDSPQWINAKSQGDAAELAVAAWFRRQGYDVFQTVGQVAFDLMLQCRLEIKHDLQAAKSGHVAIEVQHRGKPSGIMVSSAAWWCIVLDQEGVLLKADELRKTVITRRFREAAAGDRGASTVKLVPVEVLKAIKTARSISLSELAQ